MPLELPVMSSTNNPYRLGRQVVPSAYRIFLTPDLEAFSFAGRVEIDVEVKTATNTVTLHAIELALGTTTITLAGTTHTASSITYDEKYETATLHFDSELPTGTGVLEIAFDGTLNDQLHGFYRSTYKDDNGTSHTIATTQFEHSDARRAFPCWDEPSFKATYQVNLTVPSHLAAYSNSPVQSEQDLGNGLKAISYKPTMKMSTYLVAFVVGPFEETAAVDVDGVPLKVVYPKGKAGLSDLAMDSGAHALRFFSKYFNIPYPGEKLDMIAIPDFAFGAMENLGCITYRETALLVDSEKGSIAEKKRVAEVVAHEIAHMWFGDLVTMEWWEGIWLNEAFATFMQILCTHAYKPEWKMWVGFGVDRDAAMQIDGLHSTRPIEYEVISPDDTRGMFDLLTYEKGGSVLRMLEQYLGEETFRDGIRLYLKKHSYANTITTDLWDALEEHSGQPVRNVMNTFILQGGHPLVTLADGKLTQEPFAYGAKRGESSIGKSWLVPVLTRSLNGGGVSRHLLGEDTIAVEGDLPLVVNAGGSGVFRSRYGQAELAALSPRIKDLDELERATLLADSWAALFASRITWNDFLAIAKGLQGLNDPTPWATVASAFSYVNRVIYGQAKESVLAEQAREVFAPEWAKLGWDAKAGEDELTPQLRATVLGVMGNIVKDADVIAEAIRRFEANDMDGNLARTILSIVSGQDRDGDYEEFLKRYDNAPDPQTEQRYLIGLGGFNLEKTAFDAAEKAFSKFRNQDSAILLGLLSTNKVTGRKIWEYITKRWDEAMEKFPLNTHSRLAMGIPTFFQDEAFADTVEKFHNDHPLGGEQRTIQQQIERMRVGLAFASSIRSQF